jgi:CheY-like chemotaxis protein
MVTEQSYDMIILDEMMPGMTGLETLPLIKDIRPTTPVIMVTKSEEEDIEVAEWCNEAAVDSNLEKSYPTIKQVVYEYRRTSKDTLG